MHSSNFIWNCCRCQVQLLSDSNLVDHLSPIKILSHHYIPNHSNHNLNPTTNYRHLSNKKISIKLKRIQSHKQVKTQLITRVKSDKMQELHTARFKQAIHTASTQSFNKKKAITIAINSTNQSPSISRKVYNRHTYHTPHYSNIHPIKLHQLPYQPYSPNSLHNQTIQNKHKLNFQLLNSNMKHCLVTNNYHSNVQQPQKPPTANFFRRKVKKSIKQSQIIQKNQTQKKLILIKYDNILCTPKQQERNIRLSNSIKSINSYLSKVNERSIIDRKIQQSVIMVDYFNPAKNLINKWKNDDQDNLLIN